MGVEVKKKERDVDDVVWSFYSKGFGWKYMLRDLDRLGEEEKFALFTVYMEAILYFLARARQLYFELNLGDSRFFGTRAIDKEVFEEYVWARREWEKRKAGKNNKD